jgi:hypothetical protein
MSAADVARGSADGYDSGCPRVFGTLQYPCVLSFCCWVYWHVLEVSGHNKVVKRAGPLLLVKCVLANQGTHRKQILLDSALPRLSGTGHVAGQQQLGRN